MSSPDRLPEEMSSSLGKAGVLESVARMEQTLSNESRGVTRDRAMRELYDHAANVQDLVLDRNRQWLDDLSVSDSFRLELFKRFCVVTGQVVDGIFLGVGNEA